MKLVALSLLVSMMALSTMTVESRPVRGSEATEPNKKHRNLMSGMGKTSASSSESGKVSKPAMSSNRPTTLTFAYENPAANSAYQDSSKATCTADAGPYPDVATVTFTNTAGETFMTEVNGAQGTQFTIAGPFAASTTFQISGWGSCTIHTSCSQPLVQFDKFGPFKLLDDDPCTLTPPTIDECIICDSNNKQKPADITMSYNFEGLTSNYQDETKATCRLDTYPVNPEYIDVLDKNGVFQERIMGPFDSGQTFTIGTSWEFGSETNFRIPGWTGGDGAESNECYIHTSCSQPLVVGDQIGPFILLEGNDCSSGPCIEPEKLQYDCGESIVVAFDNPAPLPTDWIGIYPCDEFEYYHAVLWRWTCRVSDGKGGMVVCGGDQTNPKDEVTFDGILSYNQVGPHIWPIPPFIKADGSINRCYKAVLLRNDGISTPPYDPVCESPYFDITENSSAGCAIYPYRPPFG